jgi:heptosyltransferase III
MKITILLLARLGDIYMAWPAIRALRRMHANAEITVVTRPKFQAALSGLTEINRVETVPTTEILEPLIRLQMDPKEAFDKLSVFVDQLKAKKSDWVINWSFSPFSSYLTHAISSAETKVTGYSRFEDGYLCLPDDMSAYFYAQVGVGRANRFHLIEILASMIDVDLIPEDFAAPQMDVSRDFNLPENYIVFHIGASEKSKTLSPSKWISIISHYKKSHKNPIVLIGAKSEVELAEKIMSGASSDLVHNLVGETQVTDLFPIIQNAELLVGCDSAPIHIATLTDTPCLNISLTTVNFWETGARAEGSIVYRILSEEELPADRCAQTISKFLNNEAHELGLIPVQSGTPSYRALTTYQSDFDWNLIQAIYLQKDFPASQEAHYYEGIQKMSDINQIMIEQMKSVQHNLAVDRIAEIVQRGEEVIETIAKLVPGLVVLVRWYQTEKVRIAPASQADVLAKTIQVQEMLQKILNLYMEYSAQKNKELA